MSQKEPFTLFVVPIGCCVRYHKVKDHQLVDGALHLNEVYEKNPTIYYPGHWVYFKDEFGVSGGDETMIPEDSEWSSELMPCPFCGAGDNSKPVLGPGGVPFYPLIVTEIYRRIGESGDYVFGRGFHVMCYSCRAKSEVKHQKRFAISRWNTRASAAVAKWNMRSGGV